MTTVRLWELSNEIQDLENAIADLVDDETLTEEEREIKLQQTFSQWLSRGESFKVKAEQVDQGESSDSGICNKTDSRKGRTGSLGLNCSSFF